MTVNTKIEALRKGIVYIMVTILFFVGFTKGALVFGNEPSGMNTENNTTTELSNEVFNAEIFISPTKGLNIAVVTAEEKTDSTEVEPTLEPLVLGGAGAVLLGVGAAVAAPFVAPILFLAAILLFGVGAFLTAKGWKKIKAEPKKYKGEKIAIANYLVIGLIGVAASFYLLYLLFSL